MPASTLVTRPSYPFFSFGTRCCEARFVRCTFEIVTVRLENFVLRWKRVLNRKYASNVNMFCKVMCCIVNWCTCELSLLLSADTAQGYAASSFNNPCTFGSVFTLVAVVRARFPR